MELLLLLRLLTALNLTALADRLAALATLGDPELAEIESDLLRLFDEIRAGQHAEHLGDDTVATATEVAAAVSEVQRVAAERIDAAAERVAALDAIEVARPEPVAENGDEGDEGEGEPETPEAPAPVPEPAPEGEPEAEPVEAREPALVASAAPAAPVRPDLSALARRTPAPPAPVAEAAAEWVGPDGRTVTTFAQADQLLMETHAATAAAKGVVARIPVLSRRRANFGEDRQLLSGQDGSNTDKMLAMVASVQHSTIPGMIAAGFCAPAQPDYSQDTLGVERRPILDSHPQMELGRGRITIGAAPVLADVLIDQAGAAITNLTSAEITGGSTKTVQCFVACPTPTTTALEETAVRLCFSDWQQFSWAERNAAITQLSMVSAARQKELRLLGLIDAGSVWISAISMLGTLRDVLALADHIVAQDRTRLRDDEVRFRALFPSTLWTRMRTDMLRAMNAEIEMIDIGEAALRAAFDSRGINVTIELDSEIYGAQAGAVGGPASPVMALNTTLVWRLYPEGTWTVGTGPEMRLGVIRDSTRVGENRFETFDASWETIFRFGGWPSYRISQAVCENGMTAGTVDLTSRCAGS